MVRILVFRSLTKNPMEKDNVPFQEKKARSHNDLYDFDRPNFSLGFSSYNLQLNRTHPTKNANNVANVVEDKGKDLVLSVRERELEEDNIRLQATILKLQQDA